jgi:hypothetical protein
MIQTAPREACACDGPLGSAFEGLSVKPPVCANGTGRVIATYCIGKLTGGRESKRSATVSGYDFLPDFSHA